jgi:hypothetical protein
MHTAIEAHSRELKSIKDITIQQERLKRDKWIQEKTRQIKESTVKGLEPEIQNLVAGHKQALRQLEESLRDGFAREKAQLSDQHQAAIQVLSERHVSERQRACEEEREFARQRYAKQLDRDELEFQAQKRKLAAEHDEQRHAMAQAAALEAKQAALEAKRVVDGLKAQIEAAHEQRQRDLEDLRKRSQADVIRNQALTSK